MKSKVNLLLISLLLLDLALSSICLVSPSLWAKLIHGADFPDTLGLIRRLGGGWAAFFLIQGIALWKWPKDPAWLLIVVGIRWSELFADWFYFSYSPQLTWIGKIGLLASPPVNLLAGLFLLRAYRKAIRSEMH